MAPKSLLNNVPYLTSDIIIKTFKREKFLK